MAGDWIKMTMALQSHPKVVRILSATQSDKFRVIGGLHAVWSIFDQHSVDGELHGYTFATMDHVIGWQGFSGAMADVGWLVATTAQTLTMPDFDTHNGASAKRRAEESERKRKGRLSAKCPQDVRKVSAETQDGSQDKMRTREEKRREDVNTTSNDVVKPKQSKRTLDYSCWPEMPQQQTLDDWLAMRKRLGADVSQTVVNQFGKELHIAYAAGLSVDHCLAECITSNWRGFKYSWLKNQEASRATNQRPAIQTRSERNTQAHRDYIAKLEQEEAACRLLAGFDEQALGD